MSDEIDMTLYGHELTIEILEPRKTKRVVDVSHADGRQWRVVVNSQGDIDAVETTWRDDQLADLDRPDWLADVFERLAHAA